MAEALCRRVLVVDDVRDSADSLAMLLKLWGHQVQVAYDGQAAVEAACEFLPEVVLLDLSLPHLNGYEVAERLRQEPGLDKAVLIALSGSSREEDRRRAAEAGIDGHLPKPGNPPLLHRLLIALPCG
jgi:CheY-like chemotaxis protein